jgi:hypothetical protein
VGLPLPLWGWSNAWSDQGKLISISNCESKGEQAGAEWVFGVEILQEQPLMEFVLTICSSFLTARKAVLGLLVHVCTSQCLEVFIEDVLIGSRLTSALEPEMWIVHS